MGLELTLGDVASLAGCRDHNKKTFHKTKCFPPKNKKQFHRKNFIFNKSLFYTLPMDYPHSKSDASDRGGEWYDDDGGRRLGNRV